MLEKLFGHHLMSEKSLPEVSPGLLTHRLDGQLLVYDPRDHQVHLLDAVTARVFEMMVEGGWSWSRARDEIGSLSDVSESGVLLELSVEELRNADLVSDTVDSMPGQRVNRRDVLKKLAATGAIAAAIPGIVSINASAQAGSCFQACHGCATDDQCCGALICASARVGGHLVANVCVSGLTPPIDICAEVIL